MPDKSIRSGTLWTVFFFLSSFAKTIVLTPLMLTHWGDAAFCFWAIILSSRALIFFLPDGYIRYIANRYNLLFHADETAAGKVLSEGLAFLTVVFLLLCLPVMALLLFCPGWEVLLFNVSAPEAHAYSLTLCLGAYLFAAGLQVIQRLYAAAKEARGLVSHNMVLEVILIFSEISVLGIMIAGGAGFVQGILADCALIAAVSGLYLFYLSRRYPLPAAPLAERFRNGRTYFIQAGSLYAGNFFEKLTTDGLVLLLSFFRFDKSAIALFATVRTIANTPLLAHNLLLNTYTPQLQKYFALRDDRSLRKLLLLVRLGAGGLMLAGIVACYPLYRPVFELWTRGQLSYDLYLVMAMLIMAVFNLYAISYTFILKGLNALPQLLWVMFAKTVLILAGLYVAEGNIATAGYALAVTEMLCATFILPPVLYVYWKRNQLSVPYFKDLAAIIPYYLAAGALFLLFLRY